MVALYIKNENVFELFFISYYVLSTHLLMLSHISAIHKHTFFLIIQSAFFSDDVACISCHNDFVKKVGLPKDYT